MQGWQVYKSIDDWFDNKPAKYVAVSGSGSSVTYTLADLTPGTYYLDLWKDNDNDGDWSSGDFIALHSDNNGMLPINISTGQTLQINLSVTVL